MRRGLCFVVGLVLLSGPAVAWAQTPDEVEEMRFVEEMRRRGYTDLALEYLQRLSKNPSPQLARELPLEVAKTRVEAAGDEPDTTKRAALYQEARKEFESFLQKNPGHPRTLEVNLDIAQIAVLQGRTQLSKAFMSEESLSTETADLLKARAMLKAAGTELKKVADELDVQLGKLGEPKTPAEQQQKARVQEQRRQAELAIAVNLFDQAQTFPRNSPSDKVLLERGKWVADASKVLEKITAEDARSPAVWQAEAWLGRCYHENGEPSKARERYAKIMGQMRNPVAADGVRLARYFRLLVIEEKPEANEDRLAVIEDGAVRWLRDYPRHHRTAEGNGIRFLLAKTSLGRFQDAKLPQRTRDGYLQQARRLLALIEQTENEFTDRARRMKIGIIAEQGGFSKKVEDLKSFEDCYVRAQFENIEMDKDAQRLADADGLKEKAGQDLKSLAGWAKAVRELPQKILPSAAAEALKRAELVLKAGDEAKQTAALAAMPPLLKNIDEPFKDLEEKAREARLDTVIAALKRGLDLPEVKGKSSFEANNARAMLAFYYLNGGKLREAIAVGEEYARRDPRSSQAAMSAVYALQAYAQLLARYGDDADPDTVAKDTAAMRAFAQLMKDRWPNELAGNLARHQLALVFLREKDPGKAILELGTITTDYPTYAATQYLLADLALQAEQAGAEPLPGDKKGDFRKRALAALDGIPFPPAGEPLNAQGYFLAKCRLAEELYKDGEFQRMQKLVEPLQQRLGSVRLAEDDAKHQEMVEHFGNRIPVIQLFALYGQANAAFKDKKYAEAATLLDPMVDKVLAKQLPQVKTNQQLAQALLSMALQANLQVDKLDRARFAVQAMQAALEGGLVGGDLPPALGQVMAVIQTRVKDIKQRGDKAALQKTVDGFTKILQDLETQQKEPSAKFLYTLALCYSSMDQMRTAITLLDKVPAPRAAAGMEPLDENSPEVKMHQAVQLLRVRMLRQNKETQKAREALDQILGTKEKAGWGQKNIEALKEHLALLIDEESYAIGYALGNNLVKALAKPAEGDNRIREHYLEVYYNMVYCFMRQAQKQADNVRREKAMRDAAILITQLEKKGADFILPEWKARFDELIKTEPELKIEYEKLKST